MPAPVTESSSSSKPPASAPVSGGHEGRGNVVLRPSVIRILHRPPPALQQPGPGGTRAGGVDGAGPVLREARVGVGHQGAQAWRLTVQAPAPEVIVTETSSPLSEHY